MASNLIAVCRELVTPGSNAEGIMLYVIYAHITTILKDRRSIETYREYKEYGAKVMTYCPQIRLGLTPGEKEPQELNVGVGIFFLVD